MASLNNISNHTNKRKCLKVKRKIGKRNMTARFRRLKTEMEEISMEHGCIKEGQRKVRTKIEEINEECEQLREETKEIIRRSANTQLRLAIMFNILKAREEGDSDKTFQLTQLLREIMAREQSEA